MKILLQYTLIILLIVSACKKEKTFVEVQRRNIKELIYASATISAADMYSSFAPVPGIIDKILVQEGDTVRKGQLLAIIRRDNATLNTKDADLNLKLIRNKALDISDQLLQLQFEIDIAEQQFEKDSSLFVRQKRLWDRNIGTQNDLDRLSTIYQNSQARLNRLKSRYKIKKSQLQEQLQLEKQRAQILLEQRQNNKNDYDVLSQMDGRVYSVLKEPGEMLSSQNAIFEIGKQDDFIIEMNVDESDISAIKKGQIAYISMDAFKEESFELRIDKVQPKMDERSQTFTVEGRFISPPQPLYPGLTGEVNILITKKDNVLTVPNEYLNAKDELHTDDGLIPVNTGISTMQYTEIISGIEEGTKIYPHET